MRAVPFTSLLGLLALACSEPSTPTSEPASSTRLPEASRVLALVPTGSSSPVIELREPLPPERWQREGELWWATSEFAKQGATLPEGRAPRLLEGEETGASGAGAEVAAREGARIAWRSEAAPNGVLSWPASTGHGSPSSQGDEPGRVVAGGLVSDGFAVRAGQPVRTVPIEVAAGRELRSAVTAITLADSLSLSVSAGERLLGEFAFTPAGPGRGRLTLTLPSDLPAAAELSFQVSGPDGFLLLHTPRLVRRSSESGAMGGTESSATRPNLLVFLADTFRADNLGTYGGEHDVTPALDALAGESLVFERAWSPAAWTLPAHASLFTGLYPHEHGAVAFDRRPSERLGTLAGRLAAEGYRTCAITDGHFVSRRFGLDNGFEWFEEMSTVELYKTLLAAVDRMDDDDGRPLFLFVQTYRAHGPYAPSEHAREQYGSALGLDAAADFQERMYRELIARQEAGGEDGEALRDWMAAGDWHTVVRSTSVVQELEHPELGSEALHRLYLGGVSDLDREVGLFLDELERRDYFADGAFVFTSDHGEAFDEHDHLFHARGAWDEILRVPLLLRAPGQEPGRVTAAASLVDLAPTLAGLAGVAPSPDWRGRDLLSSPPAPVFAFDCAQGGAASGALVDGSWKLIFAADGEGKRGEALGMFDLEADPGELVDLAGMEGARLTELLERYQATLEMLTVEPQASGAAHLGAQERAQLEAMGYVDR